MQISADILWDLNQLQKLYGFMNELNVYHSSVGSSLPKPPKPWWFHVEVKLLIILMQRPELLPYTTVLLETAVVAALAGGGQAAVTAVVLTS